MSQVVTYCRVSSEEQALRDNSIPAQRKAIHRWVDQRPELRIVEDFVDEGESAYAPADRRPGFCEMIAYCKRHDVDYILVHKLDRFSRDREQSIIFKSMLRRAGVQVKSITEEFDSDTPQGFLYEGMIEVINQFYSMNLATETLKGMRENAERGYHNGGRTPYGYRLEKVTVNGREHGQLVPGPDEQVATVREIFRLSTEEGLGTSSIANTLNRRRVPGPRTRHWNKASVHGILTNRAYVGDQVWNRSRKVGRTGRTVNDESKWIVSEDAHPALVAREVYEASRKQASQRRFQVHRSPRRHVQYLLSRLIVCGRCGAHFHGRRHRQTLRKTGEKVERFFYYCGSYLSKGPEVCPPRAIERDWLDNLVLAAIRARIGTPDTLAELQRRVRERVAQRRRSFDTDMHTVQRRIAEIDLEIENYYKAIGGGMDVPLCQRFIAELTDKREQFEQEATLLRRQEWYEQALETNLAALDDFADTFRQHFDELPFGVQRKVVLHFVSKIEVVDDHRVRIHLRVPFDPQGVKLLVEQTELEEVPKNGQDGQVASGAGLNFLSGRVRGAISDLNQRLPG